MRTVKKTEVIQFPFWLGRRRCGRYMLTGRRPLLKRVGRQAFKDLYVPPGDNVGLQWICPAVAKLFFGELEPLGMKRVWLAGGARG